MLDKTQALKSLKDRQAEGQKVVFTNGCFDLIHVGHLRYLREAKGLGDILVVGLNSDSSVAKLKGQSRPILTQDDREELLLALLPVDFVFIFDEETPLNLIKEVSPDILVKGGDWAIEKIVGHEHVIDSGGQVKSLSFIEGASTTSIIEKIKST